MRVIEERLKRLKVGDSAAFPVGTYAYDIEYVWRMVLERDEEIDVITSDLGVTVHVLDGDDLDGKLICLVVVAVVLTCLIIAS